jgi:hypothetical protein
LVPHTGIAAILRWSPTEYGCYGGSGQLRWVPAGLRVRMRVQSDQPNEWSLVQPGPRPLDYMDASALPSSS